MFLRISAILTIVVGLAVPSLAVAQHAFPTETVELKEDGVRYFVEGRQRIDGRHKVVSLRRMTLEGEGEGAVLEVSGRLELKAVTGGQVRVKNLTIEVAPDCRGIYMSDVVFEGSGGFKTAEDKPTDTKIYMSKVEFGGRAALDVSMTDGRIDVHGVKSASKIRIIGVDPTEKKRSGLEAMVLGNSSERGPKFMGGFELRNAKKATVRTCRFAGGTMEIVDCTQLDFGGNLVECKEASIRHSRFDGLKKTKVASCDFVTKDVSFFSPRDEKKPDKRQRITLDQCWFKSGVTDEAILAETIKDGTRDEKCGVAVRFKRTREVPAAFAGRPSSR